MSQANKIGPPLGVVAQALRRLREQVSRAIGRILPEQTIPDANAVVSAKEKIVPEGRAATAPAKYSLLFKERMDDRLRRWYVSPDNSQETPLTIRRNYIAQLVNKTEMFAYARKNSIPLPHRYAETPDLDTIDFLALPDRIVVKPNNSADSDCVMLFSGGYEKFSGAPVPQDIRAAFVAETFSKGRFLNSETKILAEEFVQDYDDRFEIPRDFKVFVAGGSARYIQVIDRNGPKKSWSHSFYRRDWSRIDDQFNAAYIRGDNIPAPDRLDELLNLADRIATDIDCFMRLDFFISRDRVIFGEFTSYPSAGLRFTEYGARALCALMDDHPDAF